MAFVDPFSEPKMIVGVTFRSNRQPMTFAIDRDEAISMIACYHTRDRTVHGETMLFPHGSGVACIEFDEVASINITTANDAATKELYKDII